MYVSLTDQYGAQEGSQEQSDDDSGAQEARELKVKPRSLHGKVVHFPHSVGLFAEVRQSKNKPSRRGPASAEGRPFGR